MKILIWAVGLLAVFIVIMVIAVNIGSMVFDRKVKSEVETLFANNKIDQTGIIKEEDLTGLPEPVQRWLERSKIIGKEKVSTVRLKQEGYFKTGEDRPWMPFKAEQYYTADVPGFIWYTSMKFAPLFTIKGRDRYYDGHGNMLIKFLSLIKVADANGPEIDQGTLVRFLNEIMWFPMAALNDYIEWEPVDKNSARATISYKGVNASAIYYFNEDGDLVNFVAERYMDVDGGFKNERWATPINSYGEFNGVRIPTGGEGVWKLDSGDFTYIKVKIVDIDYNNPGLY